MGLKSETGRFGKADWQIIGGLLLVLFATKSAMLQLPLYWDEIYVGEMAWFAIQGHFNPAFVLQNFEDVGHPPGFAWLIALGWTVLKGFPSWWPHLLALTWAWLGLVGTYGIGRQLGGRTLGAMAAFLLLLDPHWWSLSVQAHLDNAVFGGAIFLIYLALIDRWILFAVTGTLVVLSKIYAVQALPAAGLIWCWKAKQRKGIGPMWHLVCLLVPAAAFGGWVFLHRYATGWGLYRPTDNPDNAWRISQLAVSLWRNIHQVFFSQGRVLLTCAASLAALKVWKTASTETSAGPETTRATKEKSDLPLRWGIHAALALTALIFIAFVAWGLNSKGFSYQTRYMLPVYPVVYLWGCWGLLQLLNTRAWIPAGAVAILSCALWWVPNGPPQGESSLDYTQSLEVRQRCYDFLADLKPGDDKVLTSVYPNSKEWSVPYTGYGPPLKTVGLDFLYATDWLRLDMDYAVQVDVPGTPYRYVPDLARTMRFSLLKEFRSGEWTCRVYGRTAESRTEKDFGYFGDEPLRSEWRYLGSANQMQLDVWAATLPEPVADVRLFDTSKPAQMHWTCEGKDVPFDDDLDNGFAHPLAWSLEADQLLVGVPLGQGPPAGLWQGTYRTLR